MGRITILDPTAAPPDVDADPGPDAGSLAGRTVGLRWDSPWRSWQWVIDEWAPALEDVGANVRTWLAGGRVGDEGEKTFAELNAFADEVDVAIVGLGN